MEASEVINSYKYLNCNCDKLLEAEYGFVKEGETRRGFGLRGLTLLWALSTENIQNPYC